MKKAADYIVALSVNIETPRCLQYQFHQESSMKIAKVSATLILDTALIVNLAPNRVLEELKELVVTVGKPFLRQPLTSIST